MKCLVERHDDQVRRRAGLKDGVRAVVRLFDINYENIIVLYLFIIIIYTTILLINIRVF